MNAQNHSSEGNTLSIRTIVNFPFLTTESLTELINTLGFKMGLSELRYCQNCYRNQRLNNPTINELKVIDRVFFDNSKRPAASLIGSFMTNDALVADTYADLMARRKAVHPDYAAPCSMPEMLTVLPRYLQKRTNGDIALFAGKHRDANAVALGYRKIAETGDGSTGCTAAVKLKSADTAVANGNIVYAILESFNRIAGFNERLTAFLASPEMIKHAKRTTVVDQKSVVTVLSALGYGIKLDTLHYERKDGAVSPFEPLAEADSGIITFFDKPSSVDMLLTAQLFGLRVIPLGYVVPTQSIDGVSQEGEHLSLSLPFLRSLAFSRAVGCEADGKECDTAACDSSVYINVNRDRYRMNSATASGTSYYMAGFNSVLYAYSLSVASGADEVSAAGVYTLPAGEPDEKLLGSAVELILGAYRAECEFEICDASPAVEVGDKPSLTFHTLAKTSSSIPSKFIGKGTGIYYLEPLYLENGLPDLDDLKKMHGYIRSMMTRGAVLSVHATTDDIEKTLEKMSDTVKPELTAEPLPTSRYGGFIIESHENIQGILIGRTPAEPAAQSFYNPSFNV